MAAWYYILNGVRFGPEDDDALKARVIDGTVTSDSLLWRSGVQGWQPARDFDEVKEWLNQLPPPLPSIENEIAAADGVEEPPVSAPDFSGRFPTLARDRPLAGAWSRLWARLIDLTLMSVVCGLSLGYLTPIYAPDVYSRMMALNEGVLSWLLTALALIPIAILMGIFGTTPGKALLGITVVHESWHNRFTFHLVREAKMWVSGMGIGLPIIALFTQIRQAKRVNAGLPTSYDEGFAVVFGPKANVRALLGGMVALTLLAALFSLDKLFPDTGANVGATTTSAPKTIRWINPITSQVATIDGSWRTQEPKTDTGRVFYFTSGPGASEAVFGYEHFNFVVEPSKYAEALKTALADTVIVTTNWKTASVAGHSALIATGNSVSEPNIKIGITIVVTGNDVWRILFFAGNSDVSTLTARSTLEYSLFATINKL